MLPKFSDFVNSDDCIGKKHLKVYQITTSLFKKIFEVINKPIFSRKKADMIMLTRSSERIFNPKRYTGLN